MVDLSEGGAALDDGDTCPADAATLAVGPAPHAGALVSIDATLLGQPFHAFAKVRWSSATGRMGVEFHDLAPEMLKRVRMFIEHAIATSETDARPAVDAAHGSGPTPAVIDGARRRSEGADDA